MEMEEIEQAGRQAGQGRAHINLKVLYESKRIEKAPHLKKKERIQSKRTNENDLWVLVPSMAELDCNLKLLLLFGLG